MTRRREIRKLTDEERQRKKKAILTALAKASGDGELFGSNAGMSSGGPRDYYTLSRDEIEALVNGDMAKIEAWVSNMDRNQAASLLRWLVKEKW